MKIAVLMTCHNRRQQTIAALTKLNRCQLPVNTEMAVIIVDDGSADGSGAAVRSLFPESQILEGDGSLYWTGGMRLAFDHAIRQPFDFFLWLNDDTFLETDAITRMLAAYESISSRVGPLQIVVGSTYGDTEGKVTYGGLNRRNSFFRPVTFKLVSPSVTESVEVDTMNGNCVLVPRIVVSAIGNLEGGFTHAMGDTDYGLRLRLAGGRVWTAPGFAGICVRNTRKGTFLDSCASLKQRWIRIMGPKGLPPAEWWLYVRRHGGGLFPLLWVWPYVKVIILPLVSRSAGRSERY